MNQTKQVMSNSSIRLGKRIQRKEWAKRIKKDNEIQSRRDKEIINKLRMSSYIVEYGHDE